MSTPPSAARVASVLEMIMTHLERHPTAADSIAGIRDVWLGGHATGAEVSAALEELLDAGRIAARLLPDGSFLFGRASDEKR